MATKLLTFLTLLFILLTRHIDAFCNIDTTTLNKTLSDLKNNGYIIEEGYLEWKFNKSSYGANPSFVYGIYNFERIEMQLHPIPAHININISIRSHQDIDNFWFMYGSTALLFYGCLPPSSHYFSYRSYVNRRYNPSNTTNFTSKYIPEEDPYGSLGDMLNHARINKSFDLDQNRNISIIISTGDQQSYLDISNTLISNSNINSIAMLNLDAIPSKWIKFKEKDWFLQLMNGGSIDSVGIMLRSFNTPTINVSYNEFIEYFKQNQTVYKLYKTETKVPRQSYNVSDAVIYNETSQSSLIVNEAELYETYYTEYIAHLISFMTTKDNHYQYRSTKVGVPFYKGRMAYGYECIEWGTRCLADNRDCQYFMTWPDVSYLPNDNNTIQFIIGAVHAETKVCQWGSIVPYFAQKGIVEEMTKTNYRADELVLMDNEYKLSAMKFPPNIDNQTIPTNIREKFFIIAVMRPQTVQNFQYFNQTPYFIITEDKLPYNLGYSPFHRCYVNNITKTRPPPTNVLPMTVVEFLKY